MTTKSDMPILAAVAMGCACPEAEKSTDCTGTIEPGDHIGMIDDNPDPLVFSAIPYCKPCWSIAPYET